MEMESRNLVDLWPSWFFCTIFDLNVLWLECTIDLKCGLFIEENMLVLTSKVSQGLFAVENTSHWTSLAYFTCIACSYFSDLDSFACI